MSVDKKLRARYFKRCDPRESLPPEDDRNVFDDVVAKARGRDWVEVLADRIEVSELSGLKACEFFTGLPGSGKSTELRRLEARLEAPDSAHLLTVYIDADLVIDLYGTIDVTDVLMAILARTEERVLKAEGKDSAIALQDGRLARFWHWLTTTEVALKGIEASAGAEAGIPEVGKVSMGAKVVADLKTRPTLRATVRETLANHVAPFVAKAREAMEELDDRAKARGYAGLAVIFDSLEKLQGTTESWKAVLDSAERVFSRRAADLVLPVHVLYTIPMALILRMRVPVTLLPMLKLFERNGTPAAGFEAAREIVRKRVPDEALNTFFGPTNREARLKRLIEWSGGYPREIVRLLQNCIAEPKLDEDLFTRILSMAGDEYRRTVLASAYPWLARVFLDKPDQILDAEEHREMVDRLLQNNVLLGYLNGTLWFDVHPAVRTLSGVHAEIEKLKEKREIERLPKAEAAGG